MNRLNGIDIVGLILLVLILVVLWMIKEVIERNKEADDAMILNSRGFRNFEKRDRFFRRKQRQVNRVSVKRLQIIYSQYDTLTELQDELTGIKANKKEMNYEIRLILSAMIVLFILLLPVFSKEPSAILFLTYFLVVMAILSYIRELYRKLKMKASFGNVLFFIIPLVIINATIFVATRKSPIELNIKIVDWLSEIIIIEALVLYGIQLYQKIAYRKYLGISSIVLNDYIIEKDRELWFNQR